MKYSLRDYTLVGFVAGIALIAQPGIAQNRGQNPTPSPDTSTPTPTPTPGRGTTGNIPGSNQDRFPSTQQQRFPEMQRPIYITGKVLMDDGMPPPESLVIERVCNGQPRPEGYTDSKGRFSITLGQNMAMMQDASVGSAATNPGFGGAGLGQPGTNDQSGFGGFGGSPNRGVSERDLMGCEIRAVLPGFRSDIVNLSGRRAFDNPDIGTIVLHRLANVEGTTISMLSMKAPKDAKKAFEKGVKNLQKQKLDDAQKELEKAVGIYPEYTTAWYELGRLYSAQNKMPEAKDAFGKALAADPKYVKPYRNLALLAVKEQNWQEVVDTTNRLLKLDPISYPDGYFYNAVGNFYMKNYDAAEKSAREAQKLDSQHQIPKTDHLLSAILIEKQDYSGAADALRSYMKFAPKGEDLEPMQKQLTELERVIKAHNPGAQQ